MSADRSRPASVEIREVPWDDAAAAGLRDAQRNEVAVICGGGDTEPGPHPTSADIDVMLLAYVDDEPVGCGALRARDSTHGEVKRMYVKPGFRGTGVSSAIIAALEARAIERHWHRLVLETGDLLAPAIRFYEREGFQRVPLFPPYERSTVSVCFEKKLTPSG